MSAQVAKVVRRHDTSVANKYGYARWVYRVVLCSPEQNGYLNERGVQLIHESEFVTYAGGPKDRKQRDMCERIASEANANLAIGLVWDTPAGIRNDYIIERGISLSQKEA